MSLPFPSLLRLGILAVVLHNLEEALAMPAWLDATLPVMAARLGVSVRAIPSHAAVYASLVLAALLPAVVLFLGSRAPARSRGLLACVLVVAVFFVNALWHLGVAAMLGAYAPGALTAAFVTLPYGALVLRRALRERQASGAAVATCLAAAALLHGLGAALLLRAS